MYSRHDEVPVFEYRESRLEAAHFNRVQLALKRLGEGLRLEIPGLKTLDLILQRDAWIVVDRAFNDIPVAAWTDFERERPDDLNAPVHCRIRLYHANAGVVLSQVLAEMRRKVAEWLEAHGSSAVLDFSRKDE